MDRGWKGRLVLVTGAGGFIGSHLTETLLREGARVRAFLRYTSRNRQGLLSEIPPPFRENLELYFGDLRDQESVKGAFPDVEAVFHLGALIGVPYSFLHPREVMENNTLSTMNILSAALEYKTSRVVVTSSSEVYGSAQRLPMDENHPLHPQSPYAASKVACDALALSYFHSFNLPVTVLRPFNTYGPRQSLRAVIPTVIVQALRGEPLRLGSLSPRRDFTFVEDTVRGFIDSSLSPRVLGKAVVLGNGESHSVGEVVELVQELVGRTLEVTTEERRIRPGTSEVTELLAGASLAGELLGWTPKVDLREGLGRTVQWMERHLREIPGEDYGI